MDELAAALTRRGWTLDGDTLTEPQDDDDSTEDSLFCAELGDLASTGNAGHLRPGMLALLDSEVSSMRAGCSYWSLSPSLAAAIVAAA